MNLHPAFSELGGWMAPTSSRNVNLSCYPILLRTHSRPSTSPDATPDSAFRFRIKSLLYGQMGSSSKPRWRKLSTTLLSILTRDHPLPLRLTPATAK